MIRNFNRLQLPLIRTYLTASYKNLPAWEARLTTPTLAKINLDSCKF